MAKLCQTCQQIFRHSASDSYLQRHHENLAELQQAAASGCLVCSSLWAGILRQRERQDAAGWSIGHKDSSLPVSEYRLEPPRLFVFYRENGVLRDHEVGEGKSFFMLEPWQDGPVAAHAPFGPDQAQRWFSHCLETHKGCRKTRAEAARQLPNRLLEIDKPDFGRVCLIDTLDASSVDRAGLQYATLSHCWGRSHTFRLTSTTLRSLKDGISISDLGRTFRDAVTVARKLGVSFIWIDSLCILQDPGLEDWLREAPRMTSTYGGAVCNIAATSGPDTDAGLWPRKDLGLSVQTPVITLEEGRFPRGNYVLYPWFYHVDAFKDMPLTKRAWVVQELLLAPRTIQFCGTEVFWECSELRASETYPTGLPLGMRRYDASREDIRSALIKPLGYTSRNTINVAAERQLCEAWAAILSTYGKCALTYVSDRLVAISGVAKLMQTNFNADYCAGLWKQALLPQLLWTGRTSEPRYPPAVYRAPTWSWASMDGAITFDPGWLDGDTVATVRDCHVETRTADPTVEVVRGVLRLSGWLLTIRIRQNSGLPLEQGCEIFVNGSWRWIYLNYGALRLDNEACSAGHVHALPVMVLREHAKYFREDIFTAEDVLKFLLLRSTGDTEGQFHRIGVLGVNSRDLGIPSWSSGKAADYSELGKVQNEPWTEYESRDEEGLYTVVVI